MLRLSYPLAHAFCWLTLLVASNAMAFENLVYTWRGFPTNIAQGTIAIADLKAHANKINILSSQAYHINERGVLYGSVNPQMTPIAEQNHVKLMPLIGNTDFDRKIVHAFLNDKAAQDRAIQSILALCQKQHYYGVQIDFEGMSFEDKDAFTRFYQQTAYVLHQHGFKISIALIPILTDEVPANDYLKSRYEGWSGVYDYTALGQSSDFVTLMTYDQHGSISTPGPMSGLHWNEVIIQYALKHIPADKISLGLPWHSGYWYTGKIEGNSFGSISTTLTYPELTRLMKDNNVHLQWNDEDKINYAIFRHHYLYEYLFVEDKASYAEKLKLVQKYHLRGVSNWCLGEEDPGVWNLF